MCVSHGARKRSRESFASLSVPEMRKSPEMTKIIQNRPELNAGNDDVIFLHFSCGPFHVVYCLTRAPNCRNYPAIAITYVGFGCTVQILHKKQVIVEIPFKETRMCLANACIAVWVRVQHVNDVDGLSATSLHAVGKGQSRQLLLPSCSMSARQMNLYYFLD